jgi:hypothetical protein
MDPVTFVLAALKLAPTVIAVGENFLAFENEVEAASTKDGGPTDADWDALHAREAALRAKLNTDPA